MNSIAGGARALLFTNAARLLLIAMTLPAALVGILLLLSTHATAAPLAETQAEDLRARIITSGEQAFVLAATALHRFRAGAETWTRLTSSDGLPAPPLLGLDLTGDELWVSGTGAGFTSIRAEDWQSYGPEDGYGGRVIHAVAGDEDYAYAATDSGAARFDRYVLAWETIRRPDGEPLGMARDVAIDADRVWFALDGTVAEFRKQTESIIFLPLPSKVRAPVLALRQSAGHLWALTPLGIARYDKSLQTWSEYLPGIDLPDARIHQATLDGEDLWLGTDGGLWRYRPARGIWRRDESAAAMPGDTVRAFSLLHGLWVVTERAFARYDEEAARWIDYTEHVPLPPAQALEITWSADVLLILGRDRIVFAPARGESNPRLFTFHEEPLAALGPADTGVARWRFGAGDYGLGLRKSAEEYLLLKGGATVYVQDDDDMRLPGESDYANLVHDTRFDLVLSGRLRGERTLSGHFDTTDPDNESYLISFRGSPQDRLRTASAGEMEQRFFNSRLAPGAGLDGAAARVEAGRRSETTQRRLLTADAWAGQRRTFPAREIFHAARTVYLLRHRQLVAGSEELRLDGELLRVNFDYTIDWEHGSFTLSEELLFDEGAALEISYLFEPDAAQRSAGGAGLPEDRGFYAAQVGAAPLEQIFAGFLGAGWEDSLGQRTNLASANARLEWRRPDALLRLMPEIACSRQAAGTDPAQDIAPGAATPSNDSDGHAAGLAIDARYGGFEVSASHRRFDRDFVSLEERRTRIGLMNDESNIFARLQLPSNVQATLEWEHSSSALADSAGVPSGQEGEESWLLAGVRWLPSRLPRIGFHRGRAQVDSLSDQRSRTLTRAELDMEAGPEQFAFLGIKRLSLRAQLQRSDREQQTHGTPAASAAFARRCPAGDDRRITRQGSPTDDERRITDQTFLRLNGSAGSPLAWNVDWEERWTHQPAEQGPRGLRRVQEFASSLQSCAHPSLDAYIAWEAHRDLLWMDQGGTDGFGCGRRLNAVAHFHPGWILPRLTPLSFRVDLGRAGTEAGTAGDLHPGGASLWRPANGARQTTENRLQALEARAQILAWLRLVERLEVERTATSAQADVADEEAVESEARDRRRRLENRLELRPRGGLFTVRLIFEERDSQGLTDEAESRRLNRRYNAEWSQTWGRGFLTSLLFDLSRARDSGTRPLHRWNPQLRGTYRHERWRLDTSLGLAYVFEESLSTPSAGEVALLQDERSCELSASLAAQPVRAIDLRVQHRLSWRRATDGSKGRPDHDLELRITLQAG